MSRVVTPRAPPEGYTPVQISDYEKATRTLTAISRKRIEANDLIRSNLSGQSTAKSAYAAEMVKNRNIKRNLYPLYILAEYDKNWNEYNTGAQKNLSAYESNIKNLQGAIAGYNTSEKEINAWINNYNNYLKAVEGQRQELGRFYASQTPESVSTKTITGVSGAPRLPTAEQHRAWEDPKDIKVSGTKILTPTETEAMLSQAGLTIPDLKERVAQTGEITSLTPKELEQWKKDVKEGVVRGVGEASQLRHEAIVQRELLQSRIDKLVSSGLLEIGKAKETGDIVYNTTKPVKMMSTEEIAQLNAVGFKIDYPEERSVSEGLYAWVQGQERKLETGEWEVPSEWKDEVKKGLREVALSTAAIGKFESELFGIPKAIALKMKGQQPFEYMTTVNMDTITKAEKLTDQERGQLALKVGIANLAADYVRGKPIGYLFKVVTPVIGGLARGLTTKAGRFASAVSSSSIGQKVPTEIVQTAALIKNIGMKVPWYAARVITKHPRALEIAAWTVGLGNEANKALLDIEKGESLARVAQNAFINIAGMVGTDIGIRSGYNYDIPIKYGKVEWPLWGGGKAKWNGFYTQYGDDVARLTGTVSVYDDAGKLISSSDEIVAQGGIRGGSKGFTPETKIQTQITWDALEKLGYHGDQIALLQDMVDTVRYIRGLRSAYIDDVLPGKIGALTDDGGRILKEYLMDNGDLIEQVKGSYATRAQLNEAYGFRLRGQNSLRAPNDIDLMVFGTQDDAIQFADELYSKLQGTGNTLRIDPNNPTKIQSYIDGKWKHCVEVFPHGAPGLGDTPTGMRWGHKLDTGSITIEGLPALSLGDQTVRKGTNVMGFTEGFEIGPDAWRLKDIVDFEHAARTLLDSEEVLNRAIFAKLQRVQEYYGVINVADCLDIRDEFTKIIYEATGGGQNAVNALSASGLDIYTYMYGLGLHDY
nr:hypothetical protein [Chloroflexota bacterium]